VTPTPEQQLIVAAAESSSNNLMIQALAGCGKTSTLEMIAKSKPWSSALALAFNVKTKKELERRFPKNFEIMTLNGLGHRAWQKAIEPRLQLDERKLGKLISEVARKMQVNLGEEGWDNARRLISLVMSKGIIPAKFKRSGLQLDTNEAWAEIADDNWLDITDDLIDFCRIVLTESIYASYNGNISYDDQIYMSSLFGGIFPRFDTVFVDEAQDLSPLNHLQVKRCAANRIIAVGDPHQAIYAFRGADHSSMDNLRRLRQEWKDLTLGMTFRCPKVIVARQPIDNFRAASNAPQGEILDSVWNNTFGSCEEQGGKDITWCWEDVPRIIDNKVSSIAVICRNNAPLLKLAFKLIRKGIGCQMLGREIGKGLIALSKKLCKDDKILSKECIVIITEWLEQQTNLARVNGQDGKIAGLQDRAECLIAVLETSGCADAGGLRYAIDNIFAQESGQVVLTTIHKAKGLEWDIVLHLDPWRVPSKYARKQEKEGNGKPMEQECNAKYVCETRTKHTLILANLDTFV